MYTVYINGLLSTHHEPRAVFPRTGGAVNDAAKEFSMELSDLLVYAFLFVVSLAAGFAHGMKSDIADRREAMKAGDWRRAA